MNPTHPSDLEWNGLTSLGVDERGLNMLELRVDNEPLDASNFPDLDKIGSMNPELNTDRYQDYQMQIMLLEQQNKKRPMEARQEQDSSTTSHPITPYPNGAIDIPQSLQGTTLDVLGHANLRAHQAQPPSLLPFTMSTSGLLSEMPSYEDFSTSPATAHALEGYPEIPSPI